MNLIQSNKTVFFVSGMFAGSWTWGKCHHKIFGSHALIKEPLMGISNRVDTLVEQSCEQLEKHYEKSPNPITIVGNSLGGYIALAMAVKMPEKVEQVLISGSAGFSKIHLDIKDCMGREQTVELAHRLGDLIFYDISKARQSDGDLLIADLKQYRRNMMGLFRGCNEIESEEMLKQIKCPVHAFWGANDIISPFADAEPVLKKYGVECTVLPKSGHSPMYENPNEFANWVNNCLAKGIRPLPKAA